jgi:hypothetical protein
MEREALYEIAVPNDENDGNESPFAIVLLAFNVSATFRRRRRGTFPILKRIL